MIKTILFVFGAMALLLPFSSTYAAAKTGAQIFNQSCSACHSFGPGPIKGNKASWVKIIKSTPETKSADLSNRDELIKTLTKVAITGVPAKGMPAKGTCTECSEADLQAALEYMLPKDLHK